MLVPTGFNGLNGWQLKSAVASWYGMISISLCVWSHKFRKLPTKERTLNYNIFGRVYVNLWVFSFRSIYLGQNTPFSHIFSNQNLSVCLSVCLTYLCLFAMGSGRWPNTEKFIHWSFYSQLHLFNVQREREREQVSPALPLSACVSLSGVIIHTSSSWPTMAAPALPWLLFSSLPFSSLRSTVSFWPCSALPVGFIAMQTAPNGCV